MSNSLLDPKAIVLRTVQRPPTWDEMLAPFMPFILVQVAIVLVLFLVGWLTK